ncbi:MAG: DUF11 domain-containing protein, partial [Verrucomicrobiales bacterium]|nr:DUF11 domain-containing protein [Verrucomicrobiales bacterium]
MLALLIGLLTLSSQVFSAPLIDNNAGTWLDTYNDSLGTSVVQQTVVDGASGVVKLISGQPSGSFTTVRIKPTSFNGWKRIRLDGTWSAASDVQVSLLDSANGDAPIAGFQNIPYTGPINLSSLSPTTYPEIKILVALTAGTVSPVVTATTVEWNPISHLLIDKMAVAQVQAGQSVQYRIRYSTSFVAAKDLVVWDRLPNTAQGTVTYPQNFGQNDNPVYVSATSNGQYTASAITVKGVSIPANSVYWDLGTVAEGTTDTLTFTLKTLNGTLDGTTLSNQAHADAANAAAVDSSTTNTVIRSVPAPTIKKRASTGIYALGDANYTRVNTVNCFTITAKNTYLGEGRETMYETVVYDDLTDLVGKMDPNYGGAGNPVSSINAGGTYVAAYTPPTGGASFPAVVWNAGTLPPGGTFTGSFCIKLQSSPPLASPGQYENIAWLDSARTRPSLRTLTPLKDSLIVKWPLDETPRGSFAKGDNLAGTFSINAGFNEDRTSYVLPGGTFPYGMRVTNNGLSAMNHIVMLDKIPANTTFKSAWMEDPWLQANARIFYSTTDTADWDTPPDIDITQAPSDLDPVGNTNWTDYAASPPADPTLVKWVAYYIPAVNSTFFDNTSAGWVAGAPQTVRVFFDVDVSATMLDPDPCVDQLLTNRGLFRCFGYTPLNGGAIQPASLSAHDDEPTLVGIDKPVLEFLQKGSVSPNLITNSQNLTYTATVTNTGKAMAPNVEAKITWPQAPVNGSSQFLSFVSVSPSNITNFNPGTGSVTLSLGNLAPGASVPVTLTVHAPIGIDFGTQLSFTSRVTSTGANCPPPPAFDQASAIAEMRPMLRVFKNDVLDLIPSGGYLDYTLNLYNTGKAPSHGTWVVDRIPEEMVFTEASGPQGETVWFSSDDDLPPNFLSAAQPIDASIIAAKFSPGILNDGGTPGDPSDDVWTSPFGDQTRWVAWNMDDPTASPPLYPVGMVHEVGFRVKNDLDGPGSGSAGSPSGNVIFNTAGVFSDELLQAIGNEVVTTIKDLPAILVQKTGPSVVSAGEDFAWTVSYYNNSGTADDIV